MNKPLSHVSAASAQRGLTLIELLISIGIAAVLMVGSFFGYRLIFTAKSQNEVRLLTQAGSCMVQSFSTRLDFTGANAQWAAEAGCFPERNIKGTGKKIQIIDAHGKEIKIASAEGPMNEANMAIEFTIPGQLKKEACIQTVMGLIPTVARLTVNGKLVKQFDGSLSMDAIAPNCAQKTNSIVFDMTK